MVIEWLLADNVFYKVQLTKKGEFASKLSKIAGTVAPF